MSEQLRYKDRFGVPILAGDILLIAQPNNTSEGDWSVVPHLVVAQSAVWFGEAKGYVAGVVCRALKERTKFSDFTETDLDKCVVLVRPKTEGSSYTLTSPIGADGNLPEFLASLALAKKGSEF